MTAVRGRGAGGGAHESLSKVRSQARRGWPSGLTLLTGEDAWHLEAALGEILKGLLPGGRSDPALNLFAEGKALVGEVIGAARAVGLFSTRRVVLVRDAEILEGEPEAIAEYAARPPADSFLLVRAPRLDARRRIAKALLGTARVVEFPRAGDEGEWAKYAPEVAALARERALTLDTGVDRDLLDLCEGQLYRVAAELDKLRDWKGGEGTRVSAEDLGEIVAGAERVDTWKLADAVSRRDPRAAAAAARRIAAAGESGILVVGGLASRTRALLEACARRDAGAGTDALVAAARAWRWRDELLEGLRRFDRADLLAHPARLLRADRTLKSRSIPPAAVLESLVEDLVSPGRSTGSIP